MGLTAMTGTSFTVYRHDPDDPFSLRDDFIESIYEDRSGVLWVGTQDGWLERYDRETDQFAHYQVSSHVYAIHEDSDGMFWIGIQRPWARCALTAIRARQRSVWSGRDFTSIIEDQDWSAMGGEPGRRAGTLRSRPGPVHGV